MLAGANETQYKPFRGWLASILSAVLSNIGPLQENAMGRVPQALAEQIAMLRTSLGSVGIGNWRILESDATARVEQVRQWVWRTPDIEASCNRATASCKNLARYVAVRGLMYSATNDEARRLKEEASHAIDEMERVLDDAEQSEEARILHLPW